MIAAIPEQIQTAAAIAVIIGAIVAAYIYARQGAAKAWREIAEGREALLKEREREHADALADRDATIVELRDRIVRLEEQVSSLKQHDLSAVLAWGQSHELAAAGRAVEAAERDAAQLHVLEEIRDTLSKAST